jgi:hypothetical protein
VTKKLPEALEQFDWSRTTWEGSRREQLLRWAALPLDRVILAIEEMEIMSEALNPPAPRDKNSIADR